MNQEKEEADMGGVPGVGVMASEIIGDRGDVNAVQEALGKKIKALSVESEALNITVVGGPTIRFWDDGRSCCENRYMHTDDKPEDFLGATLLDIEIADGPKTSDEYGDPKECQFLRIKTDQGDMTIANYNEHNGYYGGFWIKAVKIEQQGEGSRE